ncbi:MAG TPA: two-component sensor histidine kinase [Sphaerochaeta sp.]|nr:MAG: two-component sensor histidine kinase [Spirochaetes bacterium GWC2_52_13]HCG63604.1 two-component sensor histidine kinase [Sphaerochaeta sp.]HCS36328.1 two-component sensor histidine kinase [Sphaerochaeta sp.]
MSSARRWSFIEGKEQIFVVGGLLFLFVLLVTLVLFLSQLIIEKENTLMQFEAERGFASSTLLLLQEEHSRALEAMQEGNVRGIGVYSNAGRLMLGLGSVPNTLPLERFNDIWRNRNANQWNQGVATYNKDTGMIEYIRFSRLTIQVETGDIMLEEDGFLPSPLTFPDVLYILFDGQDYFRKVMLVRFFSAAAVLGLLAFHLLVYSIYRNNRKYRETLAKQESLVNLGEAARTLAHEIKNPLSAITLQMALLKKTLPASSKEDLMVIDQEVQRLTQLTNKVSDFLRNPVGMPEKLDIVALLESLQHTFHGKLKFVPGSLHHAYIHFDSDRARSVFENLIKNALESCTDCDPEVEVEVSRDKRHLIHIAVRDRGEGIPEQNLEKIFDPFFTTKIHGSGIGLAICRQFIRARGGNLKLYAREGGGTVAEVILPSVHI